MDQFERLIDEAAQQMVQREPSDALTTAVMDRVTSASSTGAGRRRLILKGLAATAAITALVIVASLHRAPRGVVEPAVVVSAPHASEEHPVALHAADATQNIAGETRGPSRMTQTGAQRALEGINPPDPVEAIAVSLISISPIARPDQIAIEPIDTQPLAAAND